MRVLLATRGSSGHVLPLAPFGQACRRAGHEVLVAAQRQFRENVERTGLPFAPTADPPQEEWMPLMGSFAELDMATANRLMIGEFFAGVDVRAALPGLRALVEDWRPDVVVRESWEFTSTLVAEPLGIPVVRVGLGVAAVEEESIALASPALDRARRDLGLPPDPGGERLRGSPYFTMMPEVVDRGASASSGVTRRVRAPTAETAPPLTDWWPGRDDPLVYLTFGSVTAGGHLPYFPGLYRRAVDGLAELPARILLTVGDPVRDLAELGAMPANVHVEHWVRQDAVLPRAAAVVCHGGYGSTLGALAHGVPLVQVPLFSSDQWANAEAVRAAGAGVALDADRATRRVLGLPAAEVLDGLAAAVRRVLDDPGYAREARSIAAAMRAQPPIEAAVDALGALAAR